jgi:hypothetical protein
LKGCRREALVSLLKSAYSGAHPLCRSFLV